MGTASEPTLVALWMQGSALGVIDRIESRLAALEAQRAPQPAPAQEPAPQACDDAAACLMDGCTGPAHAPAAAVTVPDLGTIHGGLDEEGRWVGPALGGVERLKASVPAAVNFDRMDGGPEVPTAPEPEPVLGTCDYRSDFSSGEGPHERRSSCLNFKPLPGRGGGR